MPDRSRAFRSPAAFRASLEKHRTNTPELLVRCYKAHASAKGLTYRQALDEALCFGWIDGVRRSLDDVSFSVRFTPRKTTLVHDFPIAATRERVFEAVSDR